MFDNARQAAEWAVGYLAAQPDYVVAVSTYVGRTEVSIDRQGLVSRVEA